MLWPVRRNGEGESDRDRSKQWVILTRQPYDLKIRGSLATMEISAIAATGYCRPRPPLSWLSRNPPSTFRFSTRLSIL
jgi:hypothetical protein